MPIRNPLTGKVYATGTAVPTSDNNAVSLQIINAFRQVSNLPTSGFTITGLAQYDSNVQVPFTDNSDKGDLRLDFQQNTQASWFLRVSDRKEDALNAPSLPLPLDGQTNGRIRVLDQQAVLGYTHLYGSDKVLDKRVTLSRTKAGKFSTSIGSTSFPIPGERTNPSVAGGLPTISITGFTGFGRQSTNPQFQNPALLEPKIISPSSKASTPSSSGMSTSTCGRGSATTIHFSGPSPTVALTASARLERRWSVRLPVRQTAPLLCPAPRQ